MDKKFAKEQAVGVIFAQKCKIAELEGTIKDLKDCLLARDSYIEEQKAIIAQDYTAGRMTELEAENSVLREQNMAGCKENKELRKALEAIIKGGANCNFQKIAKSALHTRCEIKGCECGGDAIIAGQKQ